MELPRLEMPGPKSISMRVKFAICLVRARSKALKQPGAMGLLCKARYRLEVGYLDQPASADDNWLSAHATMPPQIVKIVVFTSMFLTSLV